VFSPNEHAFTVVDHFDHWMIVLESPKALEGYETITIGHDTPVHRSAIDSTINLCQARQGNPCGFRRRDTARA
jgi:hypothetical protein